MKPNYATRISVPRNPELKDVTDAYTGEKNDILIKYVDGRYKFEIVSHNTYDSREAALEAAELVLRPKPVETLWEPLFVCGCFKGV